MNRINIFVDLGNIDVFRSLHKISPPLAFDRIDFLIKKSIEVISPWLPGFYEANYRLYHGWFDVGGMPSDLYSILKPYVVKSFPTRLKRIRIFVDLADGPACILGSRMTHTLRVERGLPSHSYQFDDMLPKGCKKPDDCAILNLKKWIKGKCPEDMGGCDVSISDAVFYRRQKLVDTTIIADVIWYALKKENIAVLSNDEDVIPGLLTASNLTDAVYWLCRNGRPREQYQSIFSKYQIGCLQCQI